MFGVTGIIISTDGDENRDVHARVLVCDHITPLDHLITSLIIPHICVRNMGNKGNFLRDLVVLFVITGLLLAVINHNHMFARWQMIIPYACFLIKFYSCQAKTVLAPMLWTVFISAWILLKVFWRLRSVFFLKIFFLISRCCLYLHQKEQMSALLLCSQN